MSAKEAAGVRCRFHDLRHMTMTRRLEHSVDFAVVADIMGWRPATSVRRATLDTSAQARNVTR
jgi:integrase